MKLIYTNDKLQELGIITDFTLDLAYGKDENDFELSVGLSDRLPRLDSGALIYEEGTEVGGIIDGPSIDTYNRTLVYKGRTYHGILDSKIICPNDGADYYSVSGTFNTIISGLIVNNQLTDLFELGQCPEIDVDTYVFPRYVGVYQALRKLSSDYNLKVSLIFNPKTKKISINFNDLEDFASDEEWDSSKYNFQISRTDRKVNHLILLGSGELKHRAVIHLFTDENGIVQPYKLIDAPLKDADYITDMSQQVLKGNLDNTEIIINDSASDVTNYEVLETIPEAWPLKYYNYYTCELQPDGTARYTQCQREYAEDWQEVTAEKYAEVNWNYVYPTYYYRQGEPGEYTYTQVEADASDVDWPEVTNISDEEWKNHYTEYYREWTDGVTTFREPIIAETKYDYKKQKNKPSDWRDNKGNYYILNNDWIYVYEVSKKINGRWRVVATDTLRNIKMKEGTDKTGRRYKLVSKKRNGPMYIRLSEWCNKMNKKLSSYSTWKPNKFYTQIAVSAPPNRFKMKVVRKNTTYTTPVWRPGTFFEKKQVEKIPSFYNNHYYKQVTDRLAPLVEQGLQRLNDIWNSDSISIQLNPEAGQYDIGDKVGATDAISGITVSSKVCKKIIKYDGSSISIDYDVSPEEVIPVK